MEVIAFKLQYHLLALEKLACPHWSGDLSGQRSDERKAGADSEKWILLTHLGWSPFSLLVCQAPRSVPHLRSMVLHKLSDSRIDFRTLQSLY